MRRTPRLLREGGGKLLAATSACTFSSLEGWAFDIEALFIARRLGYRLRALPIEWHYREQSRVQPIRDSLLMATDVARIRFNGWAGTY